MDKVFLTCVAAASLAVSGFSFASTSSQWANGNLVSSAIPYIGIQAGLGGMDTPNLPGSVKDEVKATGGNYRENNTWSISGRLFDGFLWHRGNFQYGLELGAMIYPKNKYHLDVNIPTPFSPISDVLIDIKYEGLFVDLLAVAKYHFASIWNIFAKEGIAYTHQSVTTSVVIDPLTSGDALAVTKTANRVLPEVAAGIGCNILPSVELSLSYNHVFGNEIAIDSDSGRAKVAPVDGVMFGVTWDIV